MYKSFLGKILLVILLILAGMSIAGLISSIWISPETLVDDQLLETVTQRNKLRLFLILGHVFSFLIPGLIYLALLYRNSGRSFLLADQKINFKALFWSLILLVVAYPLIAYLTLVNMSIDFPDSFMEMEESSIAILEGILKMENLGEFALNLFLVAFLPAIGEELVFRGILQNEMEKKWQNPHLAIWLAAFIFAGIHLQVQSFIPKMLLGAILGYAYVLTRNFWVPVILHLFNNGMQVIGLFMLDQELSGMEEMENQKVPVYIALISLALVFWAGKQIQKSHESKYDESKT